jgi:ribosomal protein S18 acetylase RimI-like enzyme
MSPIELRVLESFPEPETSVLQREVFADYEPSALLAEVLAAESAARSEGSIAPSQGTFRVGAFREGVLIGWSQGHREGKSQFYMLNSGVAFAERRKGIYAQLVQAVLAHAEAQGFAVVTSRHVAANVEVIIAKLRLGFLMSGFEYSEVYGPLVRLTYRVREERRRLYASRASPIRPTE